MADAIHYRAGVEVEAAIRHDIASLEAEEPFAVYEENTEALSVFLALCTQWLMSPHGGFLGLDGKTLLAYLELTEAPPARRRELYDDVQLIASGAIAAWREQAPQHTQDNQDDDE